MNDDRAMASRSPSTATPTNDADDPHRQELLGRLHEDRQELVRAAGAVRRKLSVAQDSLAFVRQGMRWLLVVGGLAAVAVSIRKRRRPPLLLTGLSIFLVQRWLASASPSARAPGDATPPLRAPRPAGEIRIHRVDAMARRNAATSRPV